MSPAGVPFNIPGRRDLLNRESRAAALTAGPGESCEVAFRCTGWGGGPIALHASSQNRGLPKMIAAAHTCDASTEMSGPADSKEAAALQARCQLAAQGNFQLCRCGTPVAPAPAIPHDPPNKSNGCQVLIFSQT
jgi:hypothetical protein